MSFITREQSDFDSKPLELYRFSMGASEWYYTSADHDVTVGEIIYSPIYISRSAFTRAGDLNKSSMSIDIKRDADVTLGFRSGWLPSIMTITISRLHYGDVGSDASVIWKGRITGCKWSGSIATLSSDSMFTLFKRLGLRRIFQVGCPHVLFGQQCGLDPVGWTAPATVVSASGSSIVLNSVGGHADGFYAGGSLTIGAKSMMIVRQVGTSINLLDAISDVVEGVTVSLLPGCNRTLSMCTGTFFNELNFGGLPFLPNDNPFTGDAIV
jgi:uncharacterized phage protein (TIGR02218 family)